MRIVFRIMVMTVVLVVIHHRGLHVSLATGGESNSAARSSNREPDTAVERVRMMEMREGKRLWEVEADRAEMFENQGKAILIQVVDPVRIVIYNGKDVLTSFAEKVVVDLKTKDLELIGRVRSESSQGTKIFTEHATWSAGSRQIRTEAPVLIEKQGYQIRGKGMVADTVLERVSIRERITSEMTLSDEEGQKR